MMGSGRGREETTLEKHEEVIRDLRNCLDPDYGCDECRFIDAGEPCTDALMQKALEALEELTGAEDGK